MRAVKGSLPHKTFRRHHLFWLEVVPSYNRYHQTRHQKALGPGPFQVPWRHRRTAPFNLYDSDKSTLKFAVPVFHSGLTQEQLRQIEMVQKKALAIILGNQYTSYGSALTFLNLEHLDDRQTELAYNFAQSKRHRWMLPTSNPALTYICQDHMLSLSGRLLCTMIVLFLNFRNKETVEVRRMWSFCYLLSSIIVMNGIWVGNNTLPANKNQYIYHNIHSVYIIVCTLYCVWYLVYNLLCVHYLVCTPYCPVCLIKKNLTMSSPK